MRDNYLALSKVYIKLDLTTPALNYSLPPSLHWILVERKNLAQHQSVLLAMIECYNRPIQLGKSVYTQASSIQEVEHYIAEGRYISLLLEGNKPVGWVWLATQGTFTLPGESFPIVIQPHQVYIGKWFIERRVVINRQYRFLAQAWIQSLKAAHRAFGFTEGVAYVEADNKSALKSAKRGGFVEYDWLNN